MPRISFKPGKFTGPPAPKQGPNPVGHDFNMLPPAYPTTTQRNFNHSDMRALSPGIPQRTPAFMKPKFG